MNSTPIGKFSAHGSAIKSHLNWCYMTSAENINKPVTKTDADFNSQVESESRASASCVKAQILNCF